MDEKVFAPEPAHITKETIYSVVGVLVVGPLMFWWKDVSWKSGIAMLPFVLAFVEGHEGRHSDLAAAIAARAQTLNLGWVETLTDLLG